MKYTLVLMLFALFSTNTFAEEKVNEAVIDDGKTLLADLTNVTSYRKFLSHFKTLPNDDYKQKMVAVGILGARVFKLQKEFDYFVKFLLKTWPDSLYVERVHIKNLSDTCQTCNGEGSAPKECTKCKGGGACTNASCSDGSVTGYDRVDGRFVAVQRTCVICKGSGKCNTCEGNGEAVGVCGKCRKTGFVYNPTKAVEAFEGLVREIVEGAGESNESLKRDEMIAQGMVEIDGEFYTKEQVAKMEQDALEARKKADEAERKAMELAENERKKQAAAGILTRVDDMLKESPDDTINRLKAFIADYPNHEKVEEIKKELEYCDLYKEAKGLEKKGAITKAIRKYQEVLKHRSSEEILEKIKKLDEQTIGL